MKKKLMTVLALVLVIAMSVAGTYAYLTSTDTVENTFTVGSVNITLDERETDVDGVPTTKTERVDHNEYKLMPGHTYTKDPTVHFAAGSEASYLFVKVENGISAYEASGDNTIASQITKNGWTALDGDSGVYYKQVDANTGAAAIDYNVFEKFVIADGAQDTDGWSDISAEKTNITVTAYAIQADGMADANAAWTAGGFGA